MAMPCSPHTVTIFRFFVEKGEITCLGLVTLETTSCDQENLRSILIIHNNVKRGEVIRERQQERFQRHSSLTGKIMSALISKKACRLNKKRGERSTTPHYSPNLQVGKRRSRCPRFPLQVWLGGVAQAGGLGDDDKEQSGAPIHRCIHSFQSKILGILL